MDFYSASVVTFDDWSAQCCVFSNLSKSKHDISTNGAYDCLWRENYAGDTGEVKLCMLIGLLDESGADEGLTDFFADKG